MTTRQAVLANVVDPSHVSLDPNTALVSDHKPNPRKKQLNETELALRREETARKRKNLSEKKLEDEKLETINRLLRKQSKPRGAKKGAGTASGGVTPKEEASAQQSNNMDVDKPVSSTDDSQAMEVDTKPLSKPVATTVTDVTPTSGALAPSSTTKPDEAQQTSSEPKGMSLSFSIPPAFLSETSLAQIPTTLPPPKGPQTCAVAKCKSPRKYRLVSDWTIGACGMSHLKILEKQTRSKAGVA
ncbi:hypothetical protein L218DRAFT_858712 [Marasmius fiardii PR-910]|nr:hypothetical protein L218DRAFT_858712 [Marasmius fiardii PR-910]